ncbi:MAG: PIN domain-containing protein [Steroidobacteraceae bacterium]
MSDLVFVDTNILIYAHDSDSGLKREKAIESLRALWESGSGRVSVQVLQEFYVNATRKLAKPIARSTAREVVGSYGSWIRDATTADTVLRASDIADMAQISFWDALIFASAEQAGATQLFSEDLNAGQSIVGIKIINPLV